MRIPPFPAINTIGSRKKIKGPERAILVCQAEFALTSAASKTKAVVTYGFSSCIVVALTAPSLKMGGLAHFDVRTKVAESFSEVILPEFLKAGRPGLSAQIVGGISTEESMGLAREIRDALRAHGICLAGMDLNNPAKPEGLLLNVKTMDLCDVVSPLPMNSNTEARLASSLDYIVRNPNGRKIRLIRGLACGS